MHPLEAYLTSLVETRGVGVKETSFYPALKTLLDAVGADLNPKVRCVIHPRGKGAGLPDGGLFPADQLRREATDPLAAGLPARAVLEVKGTKEDVESVAADEQVGKYLDRYGLVLVTNLRDFRLVQRGQGGRLETLERYNLAESEAAFWAEAVHARRMTDAHGEVFVECLKRMELFGAPLTRPKDVAEFMASYAREAKLLVEHADVPVLGAVRVALEDALGLTFRGAEGEHFFRSTLVQTLFYGIFSAWVLWHGEDPGREDHFDWRIASFHLQVPVIQALFEQVADASKIKSLGLMDVLENTGRMLNRVQRTEFFSHFDEDKAVQYFYEPFLEKFDPELRKALGVWYTPPEIVEYMVARVDHVLRTELGLPDGLADPNVVVLDVAAGTGAFVVEALRRIAATLEAKGEGALLGRSLKLAAMTRIFGFEILPAPYVVAHLQLGLYLQRLHAPLTGDERAGIYLTNSLTGWHADNMIAENKPLPGFPELAAERDAAEHVKNDTQIIVVMGNPPYNAFAGVSPVEEKGLVEPYKEGLISKWGIKKFNLDDLYVRFFRLAERRIAEMTGRGVVCYISNFSYLGDPSFVVMRQRFLKEFDALWFDCLNGDSRETGKLTPEGLPDPSVFSTPTNREGIRVGTAIGLMVRKGERDAEPVVRFRQFWGASKRADLLESLGEAEIDAGYQTASPDATSRWSFRPREVTGEYLGWPKMVDICMQPPYNGPVEGRGSALISIDRHALVDRMRAYFNPEINDDAVSLIHPSLMMTGNRIVGPEARRKLLRESHFDAARIVPYPFKPFDIRWCYLDNIRPLFSEPSPQLLTQRFPGNGFLLTRDTADKNPEGTPFYYSSRVCERDCISGHARHFPIAVLTTTSDVGSWQRNFLPPENVSNLSPTARAYLATLGITDPDADAETASLVWMHALAIGYSTAYLSENADGIRQDWPRVPLPATREALEASAALGRRVAALLDTEQPVDGVTTGAVRPELRAVAVVAQATPGVLDLAVTAGWGHGGKAGVTMPGKGRWGKRAAVGEELVAGLGETTCDVYLNDTAYWKNVPLPVWEYTIGGYQVMKKWLSYREEPLLGRPLTEDEAREVRDMARRLAALVLLAPELDANYARAKVGVWAWPGV